MHHTDLHLQLFCIKFQEVTDTLNSYLIKNITKINYIHSI